MIPLIHTIRHKHRLKGAYLAREQTFEEVVLELQFHERHRNVGATNQVTE